MPKKIGAGGKNQEYSEKVVNMDLKMDNKPV